MNALLRQSVLAEYMLSAEPQVRDRLIGNDYIYSDRMGVLTYSPLTFRAVGDIQNKILSPNRKAMAAIEENGVFTIWTSEYDTNGMPLKPKTVVFNSAVKLNNADKIGTQGAPYRFGFENNKLGIYALNGPEKSKFVGVFAETPGYTIPGQVKVLLTDAGILEMYISDQLYWTSKPAPAQPPATPPGTPTTPATQQTNNPLIGPGTSNPLTPTNEKSLFSNPVVLAGLAFAAYKFLNK